jgi:hemerythrin-like domain-containing protein
MDLTEILKAEHCHIERLIHLINIAADHLKQGRVVQPDFFLAAAKFIRVYSDGIHHRKEEGILFPVIAPGMAKAVEALLAEPELARGFTRGMAEAAQAWQNGDENTVHETVNNARNYAALLHDHILHENGVVFPATNWLITPDEQAYMSELYSNMDFNSTDVAQMLSLLDALEAQISQI